jgi:NAD-dependent deacetylase
LKNLVILTGAGISAESGIRTFRDSDGLWEEHNVMDVCSIEGWHRNPSLVLDFYNQRRKQLLLAEPNAAHYGLVKLEEAFNVQIITQNVDNLHERAGSSRVLHLHGELMKVRSDRNENHVYDVDATNPAISLGSKDEHGAQLRPHIVFFGEAVPAMTDAIELCRTADIFVIIGTSMVVYPAAGLLNYVPKNVPLFLVDPKPADLYRTDNLTVIANVATTGVEALSEILYRLK